MDQLGDMYAQIPLRERWNVRLLELAPGAAADPLAGTLKSRKLESYDALSYVWGPSKESRTIFINETWKVPITDNLFRALRRLRRRFGQRRIWVDAICINQLDNEEKSEQVGYMGATFSSASRVHVWLGESNTARSIHLKPALRGPPSQMCAILSDFIATLESIHSTLAPTRSIKVTSAEESPLDIARWFERVWTIQEFILARKVTVHWGKAKVDLGQQLPPMWDHSASSSSRKPGETPRERTKAVSKVKDSTAMLSKASERCGIDETELIAWRDSFQRLIELRRGPQFQHGEFVDTFVTMFGMGAHVPDATDARDRVFGLLGLCLEGREIDVDYGLTCAQTNSRTTFSCLRYAMDVDHLRFVQIDDHEPADLPSWVIDFTSEHEHFRTFGRLSLEGYGGKDASVFQLDNTRSVLSLTGYAFDVINESREVKDTSYLESELVDGLAHGN